MTPDASDRSETDVWDDVLRREEHLIDASPVGRFSLKTCQGCGRYAHVPVNTPHNCHRNADGTYEEGGTYQ